MNPNGLGLEQNDIRMNCFFAYNPRVMRELMSMKGEISTELRLHCTVVVSLSDGRPMQWGNYANYMRDFQSTDPIVFFLKLKLLICIKRGVSEQRARL